MSVLVNMYTKVICHGFTGSQGALHVAKTFACPNEMFIGWTKATQTLTSVQR